MKKTKLKILLTSLSLFALSATFGQVDTSKATMDSANVSVPQASPMATDSTAVDQNASSNENLSTDSTAAESKATKKREKAEKKEDKGK